jgi:uncharacterized surface protein with fasciclin (FAS1) repeats
MDTLVGRQEFSRFANAIVHSHLVQDFRGANSITVFAPTDSAVENMDPTLRDRLFPRTVDTGRTAGSQAPAAIGAHVVRGQHAAAELMRGQQFTSVADTPQIHH